MTDNTQAAPSGRTLLPAASASAREAERFAGILARVEAGDVGDTDVIKAVAAAGAGVIHALLAVASAVQETGSDTDAAASFVAKAVTEAGEQIDSRLADIDEALCNLAVEVIRPRHRWLRRR